MRTQLKHHTKNLVIITLLGTMIISSCRPVLDDLGYWSPLECVTPELVDKEAIIIVSKTSLDTLIYHANDTHSDAIVIMKDGKMVGSWYSGGYTRKIQTMSITKSIANLAIGRLLTMGLLDSIDIPMYTFIPEWENDSKSKITLRHILNHTSGIEALHTSKEIYKQRDFVEYAIHSELVSEPGSEFFYNNRAVNVLARVVEKLSGERLDIFMQQNLFKQLDILDFDWQLDEAGNPHVMAGLLIYPEDLAKIGQFMLEKGKYKGSQLILENWFEESLTPGSDVNHGCGLLWWLSYQTTYIIDTAQIDLLREKGVDSKFINQVENELLGEYEGWPEYSAALKRVFGPEYNGVTSKYLQPFNQQLSKKKYGDLISIEANGGLGQYLIIYPKERIVGVRMIEESLFFYEHGHDNYHSFSSDLVTLAL